MNVYLCIIAPPAIFYDFWVTLTVLPAFSKQSLSYPIWEIFTLVKELRRVFSYNFKHIYRYFYTLSASFLIFCF